MQQYKLREPMVGVSRDAYGHMKIITLPAGAELAITTITLHSGLVDAHWAEQPVSVFLQDLKARGDLVQTSAA